MNNNPWGIPDSNGKTSRHQSNPRDWRGDEIIFRTIVVWNISRVFECIRSNVDWSGDFIVYTYNYNVMQPNHMAILTITILYVSGISCTAIYMANYRWQ